MNFSHAADTQLLICERGGPCEGPRPGGAGPGSLPGGRGSTCGADRARGRRAGARQGTATCRAGAAAHLPGAPWLGGCDPAPDAPAAAPAGTGEPPLRARPAAPSSLGAARLCGHRRRLSRAAACRAVRQRRSRRSRFPASAMGMPVIKPRRGGAGRH